MSGLTLHVLDTMHGMPGQGIHVQLWKLTEEKRTFVSDGNTNTEGRCIMCAELEETEYELTFDIGTYFNTKQKLTEKKSFLNIVPVRFYVTNPKQHYHIPLIVTPWAYSTYRGS